MWHWYHLKLSLTSSLLITSPILSSLYSLRECFIKSNKIYYFLLNIQGHHKLFYLSFLKWLVQYWIKIGQLTISLEAVKWSTYVLNRRPNFSVKDVTFEEAWSGSNSAIHLFRVFGCVAHVYVSDNIIERDWTSIQCVLLGVSEESKVYRFYDP